MGEYLFIIIYKRDTMSCCGITCFVAILFLVANIYTMMCVDCKELKVDLYKVLNDKQKEIHQKIVDERKSIYFTGYAIGLALSIVVILFYKYAIILPNRRSQLPIWSIVCMVGAITFTTNYLYYILAPKTTYMIQHLENREQNEAWLNIYRTMQVKYPTGLVLGIVAIMIFAYSFRC